MTPSTQTALPAGINGAAMASFLAAGIGTFALGVIILLNDARLFVAPAIIPRGGGVSGRTTLAVIVWLLAWGVLHARWRARHVPPVKICARTLVLVGFGVLASIPIGPLR